VDSKRGDCLFTLSGNKGELSFALFSFAGTLYATASVDRTVRVRDAISGKYLQMRQGHTSEVLDTTSKSTGKLLTTASAQETARLYNVYNGQCLHVLSGNEDEFSLVVFLAQCTKLATASTTEECRYGMSSQALSLCLGFTATISSHLRSTMKVTQLSLEAKTIWLLYGAAEKVRRRVTGVLTATNAAIS